MSIRNNSPPPPNKKYKEETEAHPIQGGLPY